MFPNIVNDSNRETVEEFTKRIKDKSGKESRKTNYFATLNPLNRTVYGTDSQRTERERVNFEKFLSNTVIKLFSYTIAYSVAIFTCVT